MPALQYELNQRQDDFEIGLYESILRRSPDFIDVLRCLGELLAKNGYYIRGLEVDQRIVDLLPEDPTARYNLACCLSLAHRLEDAVRELGRAMELGFDDEEFLELDRDLDNIRNMPAYRRLLRRRRAA